MKRFINLVRSVIPRDPTQLLFLIGSLLLFICMQLRCFPIFANRATETYISVNDPKWGNVPKDFPSWVWFSIAARIPIVFAGGAGLFLCFWPGTRPLRRILNFVCFPALTGIALLCGRFLSLPLLSDRPYVSILEKPTHISLLALGTAWSMGPALHMSVLGIGLILLFLSRKAKGAASLPLELPFPQQSPLESDVEWNGIEAVIWASVPGMFVIHIALVLLSITAYPVFQRSLNSYFLKLLAPVEIALATGILAAVAAWAAGENRWKEFRAFVRPPEMKLGFLGAAVPIAINWLPNFAAYTWDRVQWGIHYFGQIMPPHFPEYFRIPDSIYLWYFFAAALEEVIWRGFLQPRFIRRYGVVRGILLIALSWSAFHFSGDFAGGWRDYDVPLRLVFRLALCIPMSFVFAWLTLRAGSIWPAVLAHWLHNTFAFSSFRFGIFQDDLITRMIIASSYGLLAYGLFKYWPPPRVEGEAEVIAVSDSEISL